MRAEPEPGHGACFLLVAGLLADCTQLDCPYCLAVGAAPTLSASFMQWSSMSTVRLLAAGAILSAALVSAPAFAGGDSGFYLGAGVGQAIGRRYVTSRVASRFDGDDTGFKAIAGYNFGIIPLIDLAVEGEYVDFGKPDDGGVEVDANAIAAFGLAGREPGAHRRLRQGWHVQLGCGRHRRRRRPSATTARTPPTASAPASRSRRSRSGPNTSTSTRTRPAST